MEPDYESQSKDLLFRALRAMVENIEYANRPVEYEDCNGAKCKTTRFCDFTGKDLYYVHKALIATPLDQDKTGEAVAKGIADGIIKSMNL